VKDECNLLTLKLKDFDLEIRAYNIGAAYRFVYRGNHPFDINKESSKFCFADDYQAFVPYVNDNRGGERYCFSFESYYDEQRLSEMYADSIAITPLAVCLPDGKKAVIMETGVENYPGMFLKKGDGNTLVTEFAPVPIAEEVGGFDRLNLVPTKRAPYIARLEGPQTLPWRIVLVTEKDSQLLNCDMGQLLAPECRLNDISWIKPVKVAWDWWNNWNLTGVPFHAGVNTDTYKYYIDFAKKYALEYVIIDEGWSGKESLLENLNQDIDVPAVIAYARQQGVRIILWASWRSLLNNTEKVMKHYADMGVSGFKVDFFDRDDQRVIRSSYEIAAMAAKYHLLVDYHGLKPSGIQRAYPNVVNFEGVKGLENSKWEQRTANGPIHDQPRYDCTIPYLRALPGPMDYTPGAMLNATKGNFFGNNNNPMSQGTRVHQMAMYTLFEAPLQMMADSPSKYLQNPECAAFIANIPTTFDETVVLGGEMGKWLALARRKGNTWYVAAMNNWTPRDLQLDLSFLNGRKARVFADGINADREATDWQGYEQTLDGSPVNVHLAPAGGWTAIIEN
jgi:alpha-glucosidase